ncbi:LuxR C-terminal-related transcriptional regulator [Solibacillus sp. FSL R7-0682]|uniref:LuxR C-terminal-related transcriptional regulator n=1 Tax=Solibacillus sp. FSL R7-0682 TaxID=2921690 RepID=UPI0030F5D275
MTTSEFPYLLFFKMYRGELQQETAIYIEKQISLNGEEKRTLHLISVSFIQFLANQMKKQAIHTDALQYWVQVHHKGFPIEKSKYFPQTIEHVVNQVLTEINHSHTSQILELNAQIMQQIMKSFSKWIDEPQQTISLSSQLNSQLDAFSLQLIQLNGTEDLPILLTKAEEIFQFKRCIFYSYNPWLNEFSGVIGFDLPKIQRMQGKIDLELVFAMKKPIFLKDPAPYVQQVAIDLFGLSSVIFIPVLFEQQLYGWVSFDQVGEKFECSKEQLSLLEMAGNRIGMYLARKQLRNNWNHRFDLTEKEYAILYLLAEGYSNKEMAEMIFLSEFTVRDYVQKLMLKLKAKNRTQIISTAFRIGLVD